METSKKAIVVKISNFSKSPGNDLQPEDFVTQHLSPTFKKAIEENSLLVIDLDGVKGYYFQFIRKMIKEFSRNFPPHFNHRNVLRFISFDKPIRHELCLDLLDPFS